MYWHPKHKKWDTEDKAENEKIKAKYEADCKASKIEYQKACAHHKAACEKMAKDWDKMCEKMQQSAEEADEILRNFKRGKNQAKIEDKDE